MSDIIKLENIESKLLVIGGQQVLLDRDVAELYGVETKRVNEAVKNNLDKFPDGYIFSVSEKKKLELVENFDRFNTLKYATTPPAAFSEKGLYMLATILKSPRATETTIAIVETFAKIREFARIINQLPDTQEDVQQKSLMEKSGQILSEILDDNMLEVAGDETTVEFNLALFKVKHTVKRKKRSK